MAVNLEIVKELLRSQPCPCGADTCQLRQITSPYELPMEWRIEFEERAAILEYDGGLTREDAETQAYDEIQKRMETNNRN